MEQTLAYHCLVPHLNTLRAFGIYRIDSKYPKIFQILYRIYMLLSVLAFLIYELQQLIFIYQVRDNINKIVDAMFLFLTYTDTTYKQIILWIKENTIDELITSLNDDLFNQDDPVCQTLLKNRNHSSYLLLKIFNFMVLATCLLWALIPIYLHLNGTNVEFSLWMPFDSTKGPQFYITVIYSYVQTSRQGLINSTMDCFITVFFAQCKTQITILRHELETIVEKSKNEAKSSNSSFAIVLQKRFRKIVLHYNKIISMSSKCEDVFGGAVMYQFLIGAWILCTTVYTMVDYNPFSFQYFSMVSYMACILTEIYVYCYYGNELKYESMDLLRSAFAMNWLESPQPVRRSLIIFMERIKKPIEPMAGFIIPLSATTFVSILRSSYSFYAFLNNSNN